MLTASKFKIAKETKIGYVALKVANLEKMTRFYQEVIGLQVLTQNEQESRLGVGGDVLLQLRKIANPLPLTRKTGLYHVAFLVPSRQELGNALFHYLSVSAPLTGASDHGYSEALYLTDPEGNGIEVYRDKPRAQWDIRADGSIIGVTEAMDTEGVLAARAAQWSGFGLGTTVGHVHLKVADLQASDQFYTEKLGLTLTSNFGSQAKFFAAGAYHHHLGANNWLGSHVPAMSATDLGLDYYSFLLPNHPAFEELVAHLEATEVHFERQGEQLWVMDPNGIKLLIAIE